MTDRSPDFGVVLRRRDLGLVLARIGFGDEPPAESRGAHPSDDRLVCRRDQSAAVPRALLSLDLTAVLPTITVPTLAVCGTSDVITPPAESERIAELIPGARLELFPKAGHMLMLERPPRSSTR